MEYSERTNRMLAAVPDYYEYSRVFGQVQQAMADDFELQESKAYNLQDQLYIVTATWGLRYWEKTLGIPTIETDSYDTRRSRVLSKWRGFGNFSASLIKSISEAFINGEVDVRIRVPEQQVIIIFVGKRGVPPNLNDLKAQIANIIHAHLEPVYKFTYLTWDDLDRQQITWDELDALNMTWDEFGVWQP